MHHESFIMISNRRVTFLARSMELRFSKPVSRFEIPVRVIRRMELMATVDS